MSSATNFNSTTSFFLSYFGVDRVYFNKLIDPPIALLDKGVLYEMDDGILYFNGNPVSIGGGSVTTTDITIDPSTGPYSSNTLWINNTNDHLYHGNRDTENNEPTRIYVSTNGDTLANGANGFINSPLNDMTEALTLWPIDKSGLTININGAFTNNLSLKPSTFIKGDTLSPKSLLGAIDLLDPDWATPSPYFFNQSSINNCTVLGLSNLDFSGMDKPLVIYNECSIQGGIIATGSSVASTEPGIMFCKECECTSNIQLIDMDANFQNCCFSLLTQVADIQISHLYDKDMKIFIDGCTDAGILSINHSSLANVLYIDLIGDLRFSQINVNSVGFTGGLVLTIGDTTEINFTGGTEADTIINYTKRATQVAYTPANPGDWSPVPTLVSDALDILAGTGSGTGDVVGPASSTDTAICRFDGITGKLLQNSVWTMDVNGNINLSGTKYVSRPNTTSQTLGTLAGNALGNTDVANLALGPNALQVANGCTNNCAVGSLAGQSVTTGSNNTLTGISAGVNITTGTNNIMFGNGAGLSCSTANNQIVIGNTGTNTSDAIYIGTSQTQCLVAGVYPSAGDGINFVTCDNTGKLGKNKLPVTIFGNEGTGNPWATGAVTRYAFIGGGLANQFNAYALTLTYNLDVTKLTCYTYSSLGSAGTLTYNILKNGVAVGTPVVSTCTLSTVVSVSVAQSISFVIGDTIVFQIDGNAAMSTTSLQAVYWELDGFRY